MATATAQAQVDMEVVPSWSPTVPAVREAMKFIKRRGGQIDPEELVAWDASHGRRLFNWSDAHAAVAWRVHQARMFLNSFRSIIDGLRVRAYVNVPATEDTERSYYAVERISETPILRTRVIEDIVRRMASLASELKLWKLSAEEREAVFVILRKEMAE